MSRREPTSLPGRFCPGAGGARAFLFGIAIWSWTCVIGCAPIGFQGSAPVQEPSAIPAVGEGIAAPSSVREAARLLDEARVSFTAGSFEEARAAALTVIREYPETPGSGEALEILARSALTLGFNDEAVESAERYVELLGQSHPLFPSIILLTSQARAAAGDRAGAAETLLRLPSGTPPSVAGPAGELLRESVGGMDTGALLMAAQDVPPSHPLRGVLLTELAVALHYAGDRAEAMRWAQEALAGPVEPREADLARALLDGRLEEALGDPLILGAILPRSGVSPSVLEYARALEEGIEVAVQEFQGSLRRSVRVELEDDGGLPGGGQASMGRLEEMGALGVIGPLVPEVLMAAASGRRTGVPIIAPGALPSAESAPGVFALSGPDVTGARALARHANAAGLRRVVVMRPRRDPARLEATAFREELEAAGGAISGEVLYDPGATYFREELTQVARSRPDGLFLPLAPDEIELLAPQLTFFGIDTLGIQLLGTSGWTSDDVLSRVDPRHTDGVVASSSSIVLQDMDAFHRFRSAYERIFRKTLRGHAPAFGHDAAALLLHALQGRPRNAAELTRALNQIRDFPGATGLLSVEGGLVTRAPHLAQIQGGELIPIQTRFD